MLRDQRIAILMGSHAHVGVTSAIYKHLYRSPLYETHVMALLLQYTNPRDASFKLRDVIIEEREAAAVIYDSNI
jgi:hypothetical protein